MHVIPVRRRMFTQLIACECSVNIHMYLYTCICAVAVIKIISCYYNVFLTQQFLVSDTKFQKRRLLISMAKETEHRLEIC